MVEIIEKQLINKLKNDKQKIINDNKSNEDDEEIIFYDSDEDVLNDMINELINKNINNENENDDDDIDMDMDMDMINEKPKWIIELNKLELKKNENKIKQFVTINKNNKNDDNNENDNKSKKIKNENKIKNDGDKEIEKGYTMLGNDNDDEFMKWSIKEAVGQEEYDDIVMENCHIPFPNRSTNDIESDGGFVYGHAFVKKSPKYLKYKNKNYNNNNNNKENINNFINDESDDEDNYEQVNIRNAYNNAMRNDIIKKITLIKRRKLNNFDDDDGDMAF